MFSSRLECVGRHEAVDYGCAPQHVFDVGGAGSAVLLSITQAISRLLEVVHRLVDVVFCSTAIDPAAIDRLIETGPERSDAGVHTAQQISYLLIADASGSLLCRHDHTDTREREHSR